MTGKADWSARFLEISPLFDLAALPLAVSLCIVLHGSFECVEQMIKNKEPVAFALENEHIVHYSLSLLVMLE